MIDFVIKMLKRYREQIAYLFFGGCTTLISWGVSTLFYYVIFGERFNVLSNVFSETLAITFAYVTNKIFVFQSKTTTKQNFRQELLSFFAFRILAFVLTLLAMYILVDCLSYTQWICKIIVSVVVIILNYIVSKFFVFNREKKLAKNAESSQQAQIDCCNGDGENA